MRSAKRIIKKLPGVVLIQGGWPDEARAIIQTPAFRRILSGHDVGGSCLNAGCGEGLFVSFLNSFRGLTRIIHLDLERPLLFRLPDSRHQFISGSISGLPFPDKEFDFVFCTEVLEHIPNDALAFHELSRVLRPGGLVLISTPTPPAPRDPAHAREGYTLDEIRAAFGAAGLMLLDHRYCMHVTMRLLLNIWRWQFELIGKEKSWLPRAIILALGYADRWFPFGKPFDIVALGRKV